MAKTTKDPGFGHGSKPGAKRIINNDGSSNIVHINRKSNLNDLYSFVIS